MTPQLATTCEFDAEITEKDIRLYSELSGDTNPLHMDAAYAKTTEFGRPIAHGSFLIGFVSRVLGMYIPGEKSLILSMKIQFPKPLFYPARVRVTGTLKSFNEKLEVGVVAVKIEDLTKGWWVLEAEVTFSQHALVENPVPTPKPVPSNGHTSAPAGRALLVTGGTGGIGREVIAKLAPSYPIVCLTRNTFDKMPIDGVQYVSVDLDEEAALNAFLEQHDPSQFYGVLHLSAPALHRSFITEDLPALKKHWRHAVEVPVTLAKWARQPGSAIKRLIMMGSTFGAKHPMPHMGAYSLAKAAMEHLSKLLVSDLSLQQATVNTVAVSLVPVGMNEGMSERARKSLVGKIPTGRLVTTEDVAQTFSFLLMDTAGQINGTTIILDGGLSE